MLSTCSAMRDRCAIPTVRAPAVWRAILWRSGSGGRCTSTNGPTASSNSAGLSLASSPSSRTFDAIGGELSAPRPLRRGCQLVHQARLALEEAASVEGRGQPEKREVQVMAQLVDDR